MIDQDRFSAMQDRFRGKCSDDSQTLAEISIAPDRGTGEALERLAHRISGSAGTFGFPDLSLAANRLETLLTGEESTEAHLDQAIADLSGHLDGVARGSVLPG